MLTGLGRIIKFNHTINTHDGYLSGIHLNPAGNRCSGLMNQCNLVTGDKLKKKVFNINLFHKLLGYPCEAVIKLTAKDMGVELKGAFEVCTSFALEKISKKKINKVDENKHNYR